MVTENFKTGSALFIASANLHMNVCVSWESMYLYIVDLPSLNETDSLVLVRPPRQAESAQKHFVQVICFLK